MAEAVRSLLVAGATSQIGRFLLPRLAAQGFTIHALSRKPPSSQEGEVIWHQADIVNSPLPPVKVRYLIHLAHLGLLPPLLSAYGSKERADTESCGLARVVAFGSTSVFSKQNSGDARERAVAGGLAQAEQDLVSACESWGISWTLLRPTLIYGCGIDKNVTVLVNFIRRFGFFPLVGEGRGLRQPVHADDLATACLAVLDLKASYNRAYNLSGGETLTYRMMVERVFERLGKKPRILSIPLPLFRALMKGAALLPGYRYFSTEMAERMNQDLYFEHGEAARDFGYAPRDFEPLG